MFTKTNGKFTGIMSLFLIISVISCDLNKKSESAQKTDETDEDYYVAAYVWPSCHHDQRFGDMLWPEGIGEWEIIKKGTRRFEGHYQPKIPLWGYEMDNDPKVMEKWIDVATDHNINVFIFDWYWFDNGPFLESSLNDGFLEAANNRDMKFYLMWANHDVQKSYWNVHEYKNDTTVLWEGAVDFDRFKNIAERVVNKYFIQPNYLKIDGKPVFHIFDLNKLVRGLGGLEKTKMAIEYFKKEAKKAGFPGLYVQCKDMGEMMPRLLVDDLREGHSVNEIIDLLGINSVTKYNWGHEMNDYIRLGELTIKKRKNIDSVLNIPYFPNVSIGWDATPRFPDQGKDDVIVYNKSPESFAASLQKAKNYCDEHPDQPNLITIFSWNEWVEGSYLLPDMKYGFKHLEGVKEVIDGSYDPYVNKYK